MKHTRQSYAKEWATLTGRSEKDIYIPKGLGDPEDEEGTREPGPTPSATSHRGVH